MFNKDRRQSVSAGGVSGELTNSDDNSRYGVGVKIKLFFAKHEGNYIAANIFVFFGKTAVHLFGGFDHNFRNLMAPYFMHWNQMLFAKNKMGCAIYDFWGIDEKKWPGVTHFKRSFGGKEIVYPQGRDVVFDAKWYKLFKIARKLIRPRSSAPKQRSGVVGL